MTVEVRTNPPIAKLIIRRTNPDFVKELNADPWNELAGASSVKTSKNLQFNPGSNFSMDNPKDAARYQKYRDNVEKDALKSYSAISVFIDGLDEPFLALMISNFEEYVKKDPSGVPNSFFKGTRFAGKTRSMNSIIAQMLKSHTPDNVIANVKSGVKMNWELGDLVRYACAIREALQASGVPQLKSGHTGAKSGLLKGFGIYKVA